MCDRDLFEQGCGVKRVDFSRVLVMFEGLVEGRKGMWEMKARKAQYSD